MHMKTLALTGLVTMTAAGSASAAFTGLTAELYLGDTWIADGYDTTALDTYRVYATFDNDNASVLTVGDVGGDGLSFSISSSDGAFFNDPLGNDFAPNPLLFGTSPSLQWDTYMTIGEAVGSGPGGIAMTTGAPGFDVQAAGLTGNRLLDDTGVFSLDLAQGNASGGRVLVGQFTVAEGVNVTGINWMIGGIADFLPYEVAAAFSTAIPAPGAVALLGLAGVIGRHRRRL